MNISIFGIGYVGAVSAACLARDGHEVIAVDVNPEKVATIRNGRSPIVEPGLEGLIAEARRRDRLSATTSTEEAVHGTDMSFVCVGTPAMNNGALDTRYVTRVAEQLGAAIKGKNAFHSVVVRSTVLPGTMDELIIPALERSSGKRAGEDFGIAYYPEFLREGSAIRDYDTPGAIVFGGRDETTLDRLREVHERFDVAPRIMDIRTAEAVKYVNNCWHATKISFANEIGLVCRSLGVDGQDVMETLCADTRLNISPAYLAPGFAFGGSCLPKDMKALRYRARSVDQATPLLDAVLTANDNQLRRAFELVEDSGARRVGLVGLSFKPETDDLRSSPLVDLAEMLIGRGYQVKIYDPIIRLSRLTGVNREYLLSKLSHIADLLCEDIDDLVDHSQTVVIGNRRESAAILPKLEDAGINIVDLVRVDRGRRSSGPYQGLCW